MKVLVLFFAVLLGVNAGLLSHGYAPLRTGSVSAHVPVVAARPVVVSAGVGHSGSLGGLGSGLGGLGYGYGGNSGLGGVGYGYGGHSGLIGGLGLGGHY